MHFHYMAESTDGELVFNSVLLITTNGEVFFTLVQLSTIYLLMIKCIYI